VKKALEGFMLLSKIDKHYKNIKEKQGNFLSNVLEELDLSYKIEYGKEEQIPQTGSLIVVSNHPFGGAEAAVLYDMIVKKRPDVRFLANYYLGNH
jgi:putative hemolysin